MIDMAIQKPSLQKTRDLQHLVGEKNSDRKSPIFLTNFCCLD